MTTTYIIVSYNSYSDICILLESISRQVVQPQYIIIVDNMSPNGDYIRLKTLENDQIHVVDSGRNGGFGYACNIGIQYAKTLGATHI
jgi:GT2 family glycosyltransferase